MPATDLTKADWNTVVLALARLTTERPGWDQHGNTIAEALGYGEEYRSFRRMEMCDAALDRSQLELAIAVKDGGLVSEQDLRLALLASESMLWFVDHQLRELAEAVVDDAGPGGRIRRSSFYAAEALNLLHRIFNARKAPPAQWLGPDNTPGAPGYEARYAGAKRLLHKVETKLGLPTEVPPMHVLYVTAAEHQAICNLLGYFETVPDDIAEARPTIASLRGMLERNPAVKVVMDQPAS